MGLQLSAKISHLCQNSHDAAKISHPFVKLLDFPSALVSCILSFKNLTKIAKINTGKKNYRKMKNKLETKINLKLEKN